MTNAKDGRYGRGVVRPSRIGSSYQVLIEESEWGETKKDTAETCVRDT